MSKKISEILNPPPPPPDNDEEAIIQFLQKTPEEAHVFREIVWGTTATAQADSFGVGIMAFVLEVAFDPSDKRTARLRVKLDKLVREGRVVEHHSEGKAFYWLANAA